jgi:hypothetical protein
MIGLAALAACGGGSADRLEIPDSPDGTVRVILQGLAQHRPEVLWRAMPEAYQLDVQRLSVEFADSVDPALFERMVAVTRKGVLVLQSKKELVLSSEAIRQSSADVEQLDALWEGYVHLLDTILASDLSRLDGIRNLDVDAFLESTGSSLMAQLSLLTGPGQGTDTPAALLADLEASEVMLIDGEGDRATVRITPPKRSPIDVTMVRVDGRWVPVELASQWSETVAAIETRIGALKGDQAAEIKMRALFALGMAEGLIDQLAEVDTPQDVDDLVGGFVGNMFASQVAAAQRS